jgi:methionine synthase II (cobalamin-independent)
LNCYCIVPPKPDCGFGTFSNRPMNTLDIASAKVAAMAAAARDLRGGA